VIEPRQAALDIFHAALDAADPRAAIHRAVRRKAETLMVESRQYDLPHARRIFVVGFGKASAAMAQAVEGMCGDRIEGGCVIVKYGYANPRPARIKIFEAGHPLPDENSLTGTKQVLSILHLANEDDLVLCLISGGGSALLELPVEGVSLEDLRATTNALLRSGVTINEMNALRKHLSQVKGGQLARRTAAPIVSLILSDVLGSPLDTIASGPTAPDSTSYADAMNVIIARGLREHLPRSVVEHITRGMEGRIAETPKSDDLIFSRVQNVIIADNSIACDAAAKAARELGFNTYVHSTKVQGEAREVAREYAGIAKRIVSEGEPVARPACVIAGGETTVTVRGDGRGGRSQEFALAAAIEIAGMNNVLVLSAGTDGTDGPTDAAGALSDGTTVARACNKGLDAGEFLSRNDSNRFFGPLGDLIVTGPTNTNVNDLMLVMAV
jgi:glycerate 2-kinase